MISSHLEEVESHPRQWVVQLRSFLPEISGTQGNPTHGSEWILQILCEKGSEQSTNYRWWDSAFLLSGGDVERI